MNRSLEKALSDYKSMTGNCGTFGAFFVNDFEQIRTRVIGKYAPDDTVNTWDLLLDTIDISLKFGFMVGYRAGLRKARKGMT